MTMGPAPMMRTLLMSVRLGMLISRCTAVKGLNPDGVLKNDVQAQGAHARASIKPTKRSNK